MEYYVKSFKLSDIAKLLKADIKGNPDKIIYGLAPLQSADAGQLAFLDNSKYRKFLQATKAGAVIIHPGEQEHCLVDALIVDKPYVAYAKAAQLFAYDANIAQGIHASAITGHNCTIASTAKIAANVVIADGVSIADNVSIHPGCVIGEGVTIDENTILWPNVTLYHGVNLGKDVIIHSGAIIGSDGFGMANQQGEWLKIPQIGTVIIKDKVEIGANTTIDRGALGDTVINEGVKLDNQIQIGHNVEIGEHTAIAACSGVSGSTKIGKHCMISGMVGFTGHFEVTDNVVITGMTMVSKSISKPGIYSSGTAMEPHKKWLKNAVRFRQLDDMAKKISQLEKQLATLTGEKTDNENA